MANILIQSLNGGVASQKIDTRIGLDKYESLCRVLENMLVTIYGGAEKRPGTAFVYNSSVPTGSPP